MPKDNLSLLIERIIRVRLRDEAFRRGLKSPQELALEWLQPHFDSLPLAAFELAAEAVRSKAQ